MAGGSDELQQKFETTLRNTGKNHEPFLICFSGVPLSGKSTVAKLLQSRYQMVRIENDRIRELASDLDIEVETYGFLIRLPLRRGRRHERAPGNIRR